MFGMERGGGMEVRNHGVACINNKVGIGGCISVIGDLWGEEHRGLGHEGMRWLASG